MGALRRLLLASLVGIGAFGLAATARADHDDSFVFGISIDGSGLLVAINDHDGHQGYHGHHARRGHQKGHHLHHPRGHVDHGRYDRHLAVKRHRLARKAERALAHGNYRRAQRLFNRASRVDWKRHLRYRPYAGLRHGRQRHDLRRHDRQRQGR